MDRYPPCSSSSSGGQEPPSPLRPLAARPTDVASAQRLLEVLGAHVDGLGEALLELADFIHPIPPEETGTAGPPVEPLEAWEAWNEVTNWATSAVDYLHAIGLCTGRLFESSRDTPREDGPPRSGS